MAKRTHRCGKRPCRICRRWFAKDPRVPRQTVCGREECQRERHRRDCQDWRCRNRNLVQEEKAERICRSIFITAKPGPDPGFHAPEDAVDWPVVEARLGLVTATVLQQVVRLISQMVRDEIIKIHPIKTMRYTGIPRNGPRDEIPQKHPVKTAVCPPLSASGARDQNDRSRRKS
jgi:hypothetical protein